MVNSNNSFFGGQGMTAAACTEAHMANQTRKIKVELEANQSLSVEVPLEDRSGEPMFAKLYLWLRESTALARMSGVACKVYCALLTRADFTNLDCYPSLNQIAADAGVSRRGVSVAISELIKSGLIVKQNRSTGESGLISNYYSIVRPPRAETAPARAGNALAGAKNTSTPGQIMPIPGAETAPKQETKTRNKKQDKARLSEKSSELLSGKAKAGLYRIGITQKVAVDLLKKYSGRENEIWAAIQNAESLEVTGRLQRTKAAYVTGSLLAAWEEESPVTLTKLARKRAEAAAVKQGRLKEHAGRQAAIVREQITQIKAGRL
jgi:biotin operon repressor